MEETREERFVRLAESRTNRIIAVIKSISKMSNTAIYYYDGYMIDKYFGIILSCVKESKAVFDRCITHNTYTGLSNEMYIHVPPKKDDETKKEKFERVIAKRINFLVKELILLTRLARKTNYYYEPVDVEAIYTEIQNRVVFVRRVFVYNIDDEPFEFKHRL